ncbi:MAG: hypothetical protein JWN10_680 [Solirubrobacterales bacterium]|nr:hypothetical protein [Solirubrobacterales bacterium]
MLIGAAAVLLVAAPLLFTSSGFAPDFTNHLWLNWVEGTSLLQAGHPSYFLNAHDIGVFYPFFAFYGGTLYTIVGGISDLLGGQPVAAYVGVTTLAIAGTYGGTTWLGRELGLRGPTVHAAALALVTSAYYITNLYGRGAWTEFIAVAVIAPLVASSVHLVRASAWRPWPVLVFVVSAVLFSGSHNITLVWGTTMMAFTALAVWLALGAPRTLPAHRLVMVGGLALASIAVNAWFLVPDISYAKDIAAHLQIAPGGAEVTFFDTPQLLFDPLRAVPARSSTPALYVQLPVWFLVWSLVAGAMLMWRQSSAKRLRHTWIGVTIVLTVVLCLIMFTPIWGAMPFPFDEIQFPYRLGSYAFYAVGGLVLVSALALQRAADSNGSDRSEPAVAWLRRSLALVCVISVGVCVWQQWVPTTLFAEASYTNRREALNSVNLPPRTWYEPDSYTDTQAPVVSVPVGRILIIPPGDVHGDRFADWVKVPPGPAPIQTNIAGGGYLVHISGLDRVGRNAEGLAVVRRKGTGSGPVHVVVEATHSATIVTGWVLSALGCTVILLVLAWTSIRRCLGWRAGRARPRGLRARSD